MQSTDIASVSAIARIVHPSFPEDDAVFTERVALYPAGCRLLMGEANAPQGYVLSHPWRGAPPKLNSLLRTLPAPDVYYIHDLSVLPVQRSITRSPSGRSSVSPSRTIRQCSTRSAATAATRAT